MLVKSVFFFQGGFWGQGEDPARQSQAPPPQKSHEDGGEKNKTPPTHYLPQTPLPHNKGGRDFLPPKTFPPPPLQQGGGGGPPPHWCGGGGKTPAKAPRGFREKGLGGPKKTALPPPPPVTFSLLPTGYPSGQLPPWVAKKVFFPLGGAPLGAGNFSEGDFFHNSSPPPFFPPPCLPLPPPTAPLIRLLPHSGREARRKPVSLSPSVSLQKKDETLSFSRCACLTRR